MVQHVCCTRHTGRVTPFPVPGPTGTVTPGGVSGIEAFPGGFVAFAVGAVSFAAIGGPAGMVTFCEPSSPVAIVVLLPLIVTVAWPVALPVLVKLT